MMETARAKVRGMIFAAMLLLLIVAGCGLKQETPPPANASNQEKPAPGSEQSPPKVVAIPVAGYSAPEVIGRNVFSKEPMILSTLRGKVVMLNFWATWCAPCRIEMPDMERLHQEMGDQVRIVAVGADESEPPEKLAAFARELGLTFPIVHDRGESTFTYKILGLPTSLFIDQNGIIRVRHTGPLTLEQMRSLVVETAALGKVQ